MDNFVNLHNHSDYSLLDGFGTVDEYIARAVEMGQPALGLTDHGNVCGLFSFIQKCNKAGIKPIPGIEAYVAPVNPMGAKVHQPVRYGKPGQEGIDVSGNGAYLHMTLWAMNDEGLHSLYALVREASMEGNEFNHLDLPDGEGNYYMKPRMDLDMLARHNAGLIATTGCPSGEIQTRFRLGQDEQAYDYARRMSEIFEGRYFVELMDHSMAQGKDIERVAIPKLLKLADDLNLPLLATNDSHYCNHEDAPHHEEMLCANSKATMYDLPYDEGGKRFAFNGNEYYLKTRDEMLSIPVFHEHPEAVDNTMRIADMVEHIEFKLRSDLRPEVEIPDGYDEIGWFKHEIKEGLKKKRSDASPEVKAEAVKRINHELPVFTDNNFVQYMLVVKDYIDWARNNGIRVGYGRGCFLPGSRVRIGNGIMTPIEKVKVGSKAQTHDATYHEVEKVFEYDVNNEDCVEITFNDGTIIRCTADHMLFDADNGFMQAQELHDGSVVLGPKGHKEYFDYPCDNCGTICHTTKARYDKIINKGEYKPEGEYWCNNCANANTHKIEAVKIGTIKGSARNKEDSVRKKNSESLKKHWAEHHDERIQKIEKYWDSHQEQHDMFRKHCRERNMRRYSDISELEKLANQGAGNYKHGYFHSYQMNDDIYYASSYELKALNIFETDSDIINFGRCHDRIEYISPEDNKKHWYLPDFIAEYSNGRKIVIEIKAQWQVSEPKTAAKIDAARKYYLNDGLSYQVWTEKELADRNDAWHNKFIVKSVRHFNYTGKVYDLQVEGVHNYTIENRTVHNSVGGSEIAFDLNISDTDPIRHNLMFERFLNPERLSPPDVDTDFAASRRDEVVDYVKDKYGEDHIANIITFNKFLSKTALADMARIYNIPVFESNKATKLIPEIKPNQGASLSDIYDEKSKIYTQAAEFRKLMEEEKWKPVIAAARAIEGRIKTTGVHACGIIMSSHPITDAAPMTYKHKPSKPWGSSCCQWTYEELESIGLIKMDFLSLSDLDIVGDTLANIMHTHDGKTVDIDALVHGPMDDKPTYDMLSRGETLNVFQLSSAGMQALFKRMHPKKFEDIQASVALYRPGPMGMDAHNQYADRAAGKAPAYVINERLDKVFKNSPVDDVLKNTENLVLYQEQIMNISRFLSDFSWGDADALRKGMGHKKMDVLNAMEPKFINNAVAKGYPREETTELWEYLKKFGEYGFNSCFDGRTLVCVSIGDDDYEKMRVEDIYREHESGAPLNISILSMYPDGSIKPHKVKSITKQPLKAITYTIRTESGKYCNVTGNHRLLTTAGYGTIDDGTLHVGAELMIDDDWNRRLPLETLETRRKNALIASMDEHTRQVNSERMKEYQSTLSYEDRCAHQQAIQRLHPDRNDNSVKAMYYAHLNAHDNGALNGYGIMTRLSDGRVCDSRVEAQAGEYLLSRGVDFELHKPLTNKDGQVKYCDFYADGIYFEMDGLRRGRQYFVDNKYGDDIPFVYMTPADYIDTIDAALMRHHVSNGDRIISIEPTKTLESGKPMRQTVYDIEMEHDGPANFIMQGIVSHNSHAASYAIISYETAYLKCHYPAEFMAAVLTDKIRKSKDVDDVKNAIREVREIGLKVGAIDIDNSDVGVSAVKKTSPDDPDIVFGISGIKGVSIGTAQEFVAARAKHDGKYTSVDDFMRSLPASLINKKFIDGLAGAGAFDKFGVSRRGMIACENELIDYYKSESKASAAGKESLFDFDDDDDDNNDGMGEFHIPEIQDWDWIQRLVEEEKRLGVAVSGHPLSNLGQGLEFMRKAYEISDDDYGNILTVNDAAHMKLNQYRSGRYERRPSRVIASIASIEMKTMRTGRKAIRGTIESETDSIPFAIQGDPAEKWIARFGTASGLQQNHVYVIVGNITIDYNGNHVMEAVAFEEVELDSNGCIPVWIQLTKQDRKAYKDIRSIAKKHPGDIPLMIHMDKDGYKSEVDSGLKVNCSDEFMFELEQAIGRRKFGRYAE